VRVTSGDSITEDFALKPLAPINITLAEVFCDAAREVNSPRNIRVTVDSNSTVFYKFFTASGYPNHKSWSKRSGYAIPTDLQSAWDTAGSGYSVNNYTEWTPLNGGSYIVMTHVKDDLSSQNSPEMAGMTCLIQE